MAIPTIIDNQKGNTVKKAVKILANRSKKVKIATGFFYLKGFNLVKDDLELLDKTKKVDTINTTIDQEDCVISVYDAPFKILIGDETGSSTHDKIKKGYKNRVLQKFQESIKEIKVDKGKKLNKFVNLLDDGLIEIKIYKRKKFHPKGYYFELKDDDINETAFIVGSSNFTGPGLTENLELNFFSKENSRNQKFDIWFDKRWSEAEYFRDNILKVIEENEEYKKEKQRQDEKLQKYKYLEPQEYFKRFIVDNNKLYLLPDFEKMFDEEIDVDLLNFQQLTFQHTVSKLFELGGFIIANAVGLGKTFVATKVMWHFRKIGMLKGKKILLCVPPRIKSDWKQALSQFDLSSSVKLLSMGELQKRPFDDKEFPESRRFKIKEHKDKYAMILP